MIDQKLPLSLFAYNSASNNDNYAQQKFCYKLNDNWQLDGGSS